MASAGPKDKKHKLVGRWKIVTAGNVTMFPWAKGLPKDAIFEVTEDLDFLPIEGCTDKFSQKKAMSDQSARTVRLLSEDAVRRLLLHDPGDQHEHPDPGVSPAEGTALKLVLDSGESIVFVGEYKKKGEGKVEIYGPETKSARWRTKLIEPPAGGFEFFAHGGPHGIAD